MQISGSKFAQRPVRIDAPWVRLCTGSVLAAVVLLTGTGLKPPARARTHSSHLRREDWEKFAGLLFFDFHKASLDTFAPIQLGRRAHHDLLKTIWVAGWSEDTHAPWHTHNFTIRIQDTFFTSAECLGLQFCVSGNTHYNHTLLKHFSFPTKVANTTITLWRWKVPKRVSTKLAGKFFFFDPQQAPVTCGQTLLNVGRKYREKVLCLICIWKEETHGCTHKWNLQHTRTANTHTHSHRDTNKCES